MGHQEPTNADIMRSIAELKAQVQPVVIWFDNFTMGKRISLSFLKIIAAVAGGIMTVGGAALIIWAAIKYIAAQALNK